MARVKIAAFFVLAGCACGGPAHPTTTGGGDPPADAQVAIAGDAPAEAQHPEKVVELNHDGEMVDIDAALVPGYVTIVDFWATWCGACEVMEETFMPIVADEPRILIRKVDVGDGDTPVAEHYDIGPLPHIRIYDGKGELKYILMNNNALETGEKALEVLREE